MQRCHDAHHGPVPDRHDPPQHHITRRTSERQLARLEEELEQMDAVNYTREDLTIEFAFAAAEHVAGEPANHVEPMASPDAAQWRAAEVDEINAQRKTGSYTICTLPPGRMAVGSTWAYKIKTDLEGKPVRYKARLVAQGFSQRPGCDYGETHAPVARLSSIRVSLATAAAEDMELENMDVNTAWGTSNMTLGVRSSYGGFTRASTASSSLAATGTRPSIDGCATTALSRARPIHVSTGSRLRMVGY
jgi:hypothetical protein